MKRNKIKKSTENLDLTEKEKIDIEHALNIMEKVSEAELKFAHCVMTELHAKTIFEKSGEPYEMNYKSLDWWKKGFDLQEKYETKH